MIHALGGVTLGEHVIAEECSYYIGRLNSLCMLKNTADKMYGIDADEWCKKIYEAIEKDIHFVRLRKHQLMTKRESREEQENAKND